MSLCTDECLWVKKYCNIELKGVDFRCILWGISRDEAVNRLNNYVLEDYENIYTINPFYLLVNHAWWYITEKNGNKYLIFTVNKKNELLKKYTDLRNVIKIEIGTINGGKENKSMNIKFNSDDDLPLNKPLKFHAITIIIKFVFKEDGKLYPRILLDETSYKECKNEI